MIWKSSRCTMPRIVCRVVCGRLDVIATFEPTSALVRVDLPVLGRPTKQTKPERNSVIFGILWGAAEQHSADADPPAVVRPTLGMKQQAVRYHLGAGYGNAPQLQGQQPADRVDVEVLLEFHAVQLADIFDR